MEARPRSVPVANVFISCAPERIVPSSAYDRPYLFALLVLKMLPCGQEWKDNNLGERKQVFPFKHGKINYDKLK